MKTVILLLVLLTLTLSEDDGNRRIRELREMSLNSQDRIIKIDGR